MIRLGTRASALAVAQATAVAEWLRRRGTEVELVPMRTEGDRLLDARLGDRGGKGLFVREIEEALGDGRIDLAVHSLKDLPAEQPAGLELAVFPEREDARDVLVTREGGGLGGLRPGAMVGTSSLRRRAVLLSLRDDLAIEPIRGNVETRLRKLLDGMCDAVIVAAAGLRRLGLRPDHAEALAPEVFVPAVGQGILAVEVRHDDARVRALVIPLDHRATRVAALAERAYLRRLGASCNTPMAAHAVVAGARVSMAAVVASEDGRRILRAEAAGGLEDAERLGRGLAESLLAQGAAAVTALDPGRWAS
ncbi:MAG: hydroxymethylbilane synthase [Candidatus Rokubacteria bacterium]|nr:hydroxymethylbilane synthase [Candidatus Rokubacteria bacterium]